MILQRLGESVGIKLAHGMVNLPSQQTVVKVGDRSTEGPGEYDIAGVGIHMNDNVAILFTEGIRIGIVWPHEKVAFDEDANADILITFLTDPKQITNLIKEQDPRLIILTDAASAEEVAKQDGLELAREATYKVTAASLPADERVFMLLV